MALSSSFASNTLPTVKTIAYDNKIITEVLFTVHLNPVFRFSVIFAILNVSWVSQNVSTLQKSMRHCFVIIRVFILKFSVLRNSWKCIMIGIPSFYI